MKKFGIFYGSATGTTASVAEKIADSLGHDNTDIFNVSEVTPDMFGNYDTLILGTSTWGDGEVEEDWYDVLNGLCVLSLKDKKIALFGCGDETMSETFCNGVGELYNRLTGTGANFIGNFNTFGYSFNHSSAVRNDLAVGLLLDEVNHPDLTDQRIKNWTDLIKNA